MMILRLLCLTTLVLLIEGNLEFKLVDEDGQDTTPSGLLLAYRPDLDKWGTVCDHGYYDNAARVTCLDMGYPGSSRRWSGDEWSIQRSYDIVLDDFQCYSSARTNADCSYSSSHDCDHSADVFLTCKSPCSVNTFYHITEDGYNFDNTFDYDTSRCDPCPSGATSTGGTVTRCECPAGQYWSSTTCLDRLEFKLVDENGRDTTLSGLLLAYNPDLDKWGTVCYDFYRNDYSARVICLDMGYPGSNGLWTAGHGYYTWNIQHSYDIVLDELKCDSSDRTSADCRYGLSSRYCEHSQDVFITCASSTDLEFKLVDWKGQDTTDWGLLLAYKQGLGKWGTVSYDSDDEYSDDAVRVICLDMGYPGSNVSGWTSEDKWSIQSSYDILLDDFSCDSNASTYADCTYSTICPGCVHDGDVFLACTYSSTDILTIALTTLVIVLLNLSL